MSSFRVFPWALGRAYSRHGFKARHVLFRIDGVGLTKWCEKGNGYDEKIGDVGIAHRRHELLGGGCIV